MDYTTILIISFCIFAIGVYFGGRNNRRYPPQNDDPRSGVYPPYPPYYPPYYPHYPPPGYPHEQYPREPENDWTGSWLIVILLLVVCYFAFRGNNNNTKQERANMPSGSSINIQSSNNSKQVTQPKRSEERTAPGNNEKFYFQER